jgi:hypothetical protein
MAIRCMIAAASLAAAMTYATTSSADALTGPMRGVAFNQLNVNIGGASGPIGDSADGNPANSSPNRNAIYYVLDNQDDDDPSSNQVVGQAIRAQIDNLLTAYEHAGINTIRLVISATFIQDYCNGSGSHPTTDPNYANSYCRSFSYPGLLSDPNNGGKPTNQALFDAVNSLLAKFNAGTHAGNFKVDLSTTGIGTAQIQSDGSKLKNFTCESLGGGGDTNNAHFDPPCADFGDSNNPPFDVPFGNDEEYLSGWFANVIGPHQDQIALAEIGVTLRMCQGTTCDGDSSATTQEINNGEFIKVLWAWEQSVIKPQYPAVAVTYETEAQNSSLSGAPDPSQVAAIAGWSWAHTPGVPYNSISIYPAEAHGTSEAQYESATNALLNAYYGASHGVPLWLDEFGATVSYVPTGVTPPSNPNNTNDAVKLLDGFLTASTCQAGLGRDIPKIVWIGTDDLNTNQLGSERELFRLISGFDADNVPITLQQWSNVNQWYQTADTSTPANGYVATLKATAIGGQLSSCGIPSGAPSFSMVSGPSHGTMSITNASTGAFSYTPASGFWGNDSFVFANAVTQVGSTQVPVSTGTESIYVYDPAIMSVLIN